MPAPRPQPSSAAGGAASQVAHGDLRGGTPRSEVARRWVGLAVVVAAGTALGDAAGLPSAGLFAGMLVGIAYALLAAGTVRLAAPAVAVTGAEAIVGVTLGAYVELSTVKAVGADVVPIVLVSLGTLGLTVLSGFLLARWTELDRATASFGMIAGGATGIIVIAQRLGADERIVAVLQYVRVLLVMALTPLVAAVLFSSHHDGSGGGLGGHGAVLEGLVFCAVSAGIGLGLARRVPMPAPTLLWPLLVAGGLTVSGVFDAGVPSLVGQVAFAVIGVKVGLSFTPQALRDAGRSLPAALGLTLGLLAGCGALALVLAALTGVSDFDAYLATTPGGLYAVLAVAVGGGANTTFILAVQVLRLFVMLGAAPILARRRGGPRRQLSGHSTCAATSAAVTSSRVPRCVGR